MQRAYINRIATAVPAHDVHRKFLDYAPSMVGDPRARRLFQRMAERAQIEHRYSFVAPHADPAHLDRGGLFRRGAFPSTAARMRLYEAHAPDLALETLANLDLGGDADRVTHLLVTSCTGFYAPGLDLQIISRLGLRPETERTMIGFMGCQAAIPALKLAAHIVRSQPAARVLTVHLELCTIHLQETEQLESLLSFVLFADGCAASLVSAEPAGLEITGFKAAVLPQSAGLITWHVGDQGFLMWLDGAVPGTIARGLPGHARDLLKGRPPGELLWAVHPGGRSVLDAVEDSLGLPAESLAASRGVLRDYGNMSSPTVMFVLSRLLGRARRGEEGVAIAFGPGLTAEGMTFRAAEGAWPT